MTPPPDWILIFGIIALVLAGLAAQSWRGLVTLTEIALPMLLPVKWLGLAKVFAVQAEKWVSHLHSGGTHYSVMASRSWATLILSVILAALSMIAWRLVWRAEHEDAVDANGAAS